MGYKKRKTHEEFVKEIEEKFPNKFIFIDKYKGTKYKVKLLCTDCNNEIEVFPHALLRQNSNGCRICAVKLRTMSPEKFEQRLKEEGNNEYIPLSPYINYRKKIKIKHINCGYEYYVSPSHFFSSKSRCPKCKGVKPLTKEEMIEEFNKTNRNEYELIEIFNSKTIRVKHKVCNYEWNLNYYNFITKKSNCPKCSRKNYKRTQEEFIKEIYELVRNEYEVIGKFINTKTKIEMLHRKCGNVFFVTPSHFISAGVRCNECFYNSQSKKEEEIARFLESLNVKFERQYKFDDCRYKLPLPFDFAIFDNDGKLLFLLEYHGEQHYREVDYFGGKEKLKEQKRNDEIKAKYCKNNGIKLIIIPYKSFKNFKQIINNQLKVSLHV